MSANLPGVPYFVPNGYVSALPVPVGSVGAAGAGAAGAGAAGAAVAAAAAVAPVNPAPITPRYFFPSPDGESIIESDVSSYRFPDGVPIQTFMAERVYGNAPHKLLGRGGYSHVYKLNFGAKSFVLKVLSYGIPLSAIHHEITILRRLKGKWFSVQIIAAGLVPRDMSYILYPFVEGQTLLELEQLLGLVDRDFNPTGKVLNEVEREAFREAYNLLIIATQQLHQMGIVHHDIKHENIWVSPDALPFFLDFGLAAFIGEPTIYQGTNGFVRDQRYIGRNAPPATADINWYALGKTFETVNPNRRGRSLHRNLQMPNLTNNVAKGIIYEGGRRTRKQKKQKTQRKQKAGYRF
jgi:predicted Ser/Thr protein kinase